MTTPAATVYWRPGCPFCEGLFAGLDKHGLEVQRHNIWESDEHAAAVRAIANGNETVPTVVVGDRQMVNPTAEQVLAAVADIAPGQLPEGYKPPQSGRVAKALGKILGAE